jgi:hypothetical protein
MNLDAILEVAIGLVTAWLTLSVAVSQIQEWISSALAWRAKNLEKSILSMLGDDQMVKNFYDNPLIQSLSEPGKNRKPSYIPAATFATVMMDIFMNAGTPAGEKAALGSTGPSINQINAGIMNIKQENPSLGKIMDHMFPHLSNSLVSVDQSMAQARINMENWYNSVQERATGWYKRNLGVWAFVIGMIIAFTFNIDTVQITNTLWKAPTVRQALIAQATNTAATGPSSNTLSQLLKPQDYADSLAVPFGWSTAPSTDSSMQCGWVPGQNVHPGIWIQNQCNFIVNLPDMNNLWGWLSKILGILLSGVAAAQGSPFWFDILKKLVNFRSSGSTPSTAVQPAPTVPAYTPVPMQTSPQDQSQTPSQDPSSQPVG